jgi:hypothetical protein
MNGMGWLSDRDPKLYVSTLVALEDLRSSIFAAATDGPLLSRVRRTLARSRPGKREFPSFTVSNLAAIVIALALPAVMVEGEQVANQTAVKEARQDNQLDAAAEETNRVLDVMPTRNYSTIVGALHTLARTVGGSEWSEARLQGVLGHAFSFEMKEGAGDVWQEASLDYHGLFFEMLPRRGYRFQRFEAKQKNAEGDFSKLKADAWNAVRASIDRGMPAIAWQPMSREQKAAGLRAGAWGLLVGYDKTDETFTVRHQYHKKGRESYTVRYDAIGHSDPSEWFCVLVYDGTDTVDATDTHVTALRNAVAFANGTRFGAGDSQHRADARGFAAYELWRVAIESGEADPKHSLNHARELVNWRGHAAAYLRELAEILPDARSRLEQGAAHYDRLIETAAKLQAYCKPLEKAGAFPKDSGTEAGNLVTSLLRSEREAIAHIKGALEILGVSTGAGG